MPDPVAGTKVKPHEKEAIEDVAIHLNKTESWVNRNMTVDTAVKIADALDELEGEAT